MEEIKQQGKGDLEAVIVNRVIKLQQGAADDIRRELTILAQRLESADTPISEISQITQAIAAKGRDLEGVQAKNRETETVGENVIKAKADMETNLKLLGFSPEQIAAAFGVMAIVLNGDVAVDGQEPALQLPVKDGQTGQKRERKSHRGLRKTLADEVLTEPGIKTVFIPVANNLQTRLMLADLLLKNHNQLRQCGIEDLTCDWQKLESQAKSLGRRAEDKNKELSPEEVGELAMRSKEVLRILLTTEDESQFFEQRKRIFCGIDRHVAWDIAVKLRNQAIRQCRQREFDGILIDLKENLQGYTSQYDKTTHTWEVNMGKN